MTADISPFPPRRIARNQARADLCRIEAALIKAGVEADILHGASDEGDPWVVFCNPKTGDVIAHVAVIDGEIVADSPAFTQPMRTRDIVALLKQLALKVKTAGLIGPMGVPGTNVMITAAVALAALHLSDADAADWLPIAPGALAGVVEQIGIGQAVVVASAIAIVEHLPDSWLAALASSAGHRHQPDAPALGSPLHREIEPHQSLEGPKDLQGLKELHAPLELQAPMDSQGPMDLQGPLAPAAPQPAQPAPLFRLIPAQESTPPLDRPVRADATPETEPSLAAQSGGETIIQVAAGLDERVDVALGDPAEINTIAPGLSGVIDVAARELGMIAPHQVMTVRVVNDDDHLAVEASVGEVSKVNFTLDFSLNDVNFTSESISQDVTYAFVDGSMLNIVGVAPGTLPAALWVDVG